MRKSLVVAVREYQSAVKTKAFIISLVAMPVLMGGSIVVTKLLEDKVDTTDKRVVVMDRSERLYDQLHAAANAYNEHAIRDPQSGRQVRPRYLFEEAASTKGRPTDRELAEHGQRVRSGEAYAFVVIGPEAEDTAANSNGLVDIYSDAPVFSEFRNWFRDQLNEAVREHRFAAAGLPKSEVDRALSQVPLEYYKPLGIDKAGEVTGGGKRSKGADIGVPLILMMLMFMVVTVGATPLLSSVLEEKMQRIAEVLLGSLTPFELMAGKLLGVVGVSLTIVSLYLLGGVLAAKFAGQADLIPPNLGALLFWFIAFAALSVLMFGAMFIAVGAACSDMKEAQNMLFPVWMIIVIPMFVWFNVVREPASTFSLAMSLFPPATPMLMVLRTAALPSIPLWQPLLGMALVIGTTLLCVFAAGRIFRVGILMQGKGGRFTDLARWALKG